MTLNVRIGNDTFLAEGDFAFGDDNLQRFYRDWLAKTNFVSSDAATIARVNEDTRKINAASSTLGGVAEQLDGLAPTQPVT